MTHLFNHEAPLGPELAQELLSFIPYEFGYQPRDSLVALSILPEAHGNEVGLCGRFDLAAFEDPAGAQVARQRILGQFKAQVDYRGYLVIYSDSFLEYLNGSTHTDHEDACRGLAITSELSRWFDDPAFHPRRAFVVGTRKWRCIACPQAGHCPPSGREVKEFSTTSYTLQMMFEGRSFALSREGLVEVPDFIGDDANERWQEEFLGSLPQKVLDQRWGRDLSHLWQKFLTQPVPVIDAGSDRAREVAMLALSLHSIPIRDNVIYALCMRTLPRTFTALNADCFNEMFRAPYHPARDYSIGALARLEVLAAACSKELRLPILTVWAWCQWWFAHGTAANILCEKALALDPDYSLAGILDEVLRKNALPPWLSDQFGQGS